MVDAWANRDPAEYGVTDDAYDTRILGFLVDRLLLGLDVPFPEAGTLSVFRHRVIGDN